MSQQIIRPTDPTARIIPAAVTTGLKTPNDLLEKSMEFDALKTDYNEGYARPWRFEFTPEMRFMPMDRLTGVAVAPATMGEHAFSQVVGLLGNTAYGYRSNRQLPFDYLWTLANQADYAPALSALMNVHLAKRSGDLFVRTYGEGDQAVRAVLSSQYAPVSNTKMLAAFRDAYDAFMIENGTDTPPTGSVIRSWVGPNDFTLKSVFYGITPKKTANPRDFDTPDGRPPYGIGVMMSNSEIGRGSVKVAALIQRGSCENTTIVDAGEHSLDIVHRGSAQAIYDRVRRALVHALSISADSLETFLRMDEEPMPSFQSVITKLSMREGWNVDVTDAVRQGAEARETVGALINGITFAAHTRLAGQEAVDMERFAGRILREPARELRGVS